jgi:hypothetical protein
MMMVPESLSKDDIEWPIFEGKLEDYLDMESKDETEVYFSIFDEKPEKLTF